MGRIDIRAWDEGAAKLRNVLVRQLGWRETQAGYP